MKKSETVERRAVHIAAVCLVNAGTCRYDDVCKCKKGYPSVEDCVKCLEKWLMHRARKELGK